CGDDRGATRPTLDSSRRPEAFADVGAEITAKHAHLPDVRIRFGDGGFQGWRESDDVGDALASGDEFTIVVLCNFVPPDVAIEFSSDIDGKLRAANLIERIAVTRE